MTLRQVLFTITSLACVLLVGYVLADIVFHPQTPATKPLLLKNVGGRDFSYAQSTESNNWSTWHWSGLLLCSSVLLLVTLGVSKTKRIKRVPVGIAAMVALLLLLLQQPIVGAESGYYFAGFDEACPTEYLWWSGCYFEAVITPGDTIKGSGDSSLLYSYIGGLWGSETWVAGHQCQDGVYNLFVMWIHNGFYTWQLGPTLAPGKSHWIFWHYSRNIGCWEFEFLPVGSNVTLWKGQTTVDVGVPIWFIGGTSTGKTRCRMGSKFTMCLIDVHEKGETKFVPFAIPYESFTWIEKCEYPPFHVTDPKLVTPIQSGFCTYGGLPTSGPGSRTALWT